MKQKSSPEHLSHIAPLVREMPLCWIVPHANPAEAMLMPVLIETDENDRPTGLLGHLPNYAATKKTLERDPKAHFLFLGPNSLITPAMARESDWAPTWNFAAARLSGTVRLAPERTRESVEQAVSRLVTDSAWSLDDLGARQDTLLNAITGFDVTDLQITPSMKLGQDERPDVFASIVEALGDDPLAAWMTRAARPQAQK